VDTTLLLELGILPRSASETILARSIWHNRTIGQRPRSSSDRVEIRDFGVYQLCGGGCTGSDSGSIERQNASPCCSHLSESRHPEIVTYRSPSRSTRLNPDNLAVLHDPDGKVNIN